MAFKFLNYPSPYLCSRCGKNPQAAPNCSLCSSCSVESEREAQSALRCTVGAAEAIKAARRTDAPIDFTIDTWECGTEEMRLVRLVDQSHRVEARRPGEQWRSLKDDCESLAARIQQLRKLLGLPPTS